MINEWANKYIYVQNERRKISKTFLECQSLAKEETHSFHLALAVGT